MWVVPANDLEALEIIRLLEEQGEEVLVSRQPHGATWAGLEPEILKALESARPERPDVQILGVELGGRDPWGAVNVDHHRYRDEDRWNLLSSLEQVGALLQMPLSRRQQLAALNDRGWIPAMTEAGATAEEIREIREEDIRAQGHGPEARVQAESDIRGGQRFGDCVVMRCPQGANPWHADLLYGQANEVLHVGPDEWSYSGPRHLALMKLELDEVCWAGGAEKSGYFGVRRPGERSRRLVLQLLFGAQAVAVGDFLLLT